MNKKVNIFLLGGDIFMLEIHLRQPGFTYSAYEPFARNKARKGNSKKQEIQEIFIKMKRQNLFSTRYCFYGL